MCGPLLLFVNLCDSPTVLASLFFDKRGFRFFIAKNKTFPRLAVSLFCCIFFFVVPSFHWICKCQSRHWWIYNFSHPNVSFQKWVIPGLFFFYFCLCNTIKLTVNKCCTKIWPCLDSYRRPLVLEATALPTEQQPLPTSHNHCPKPFI